MPDYRELANRLDALHELGIFLDLEQDGGPHNGYSQKTLDELHTERVVILSMDGGGNHFSFAAYLLNQLSLVAGKGSHCYLPGLFDVIVGVSAGAVTTGMIGASVLPGPAGRDWRTTEGILKFWEVDAGYIFEPRQQWYLDLVDGLRDLGLSDIAYITRLMELIFCAPVYSKAGLRSRAFGAVGDMTMGQLVKEAGVGLIMQSQDLASGYINPIGCVPVPGHDGATAAYLSSHRILARGALEAAASPPLFTQIFGSNTDGGYGIFNDPDELFLARLMDADQRYFRTTPEATPAFRKKYVDIQSKYEGAGGPNKVALLSLGVPFLPRELMIESVAQRQFLPGFTFAMHFIMNAYSNASYTQNSILRQRQLTPWLDFRRFNMDFNAGVLTNPRQLGAHAQEFGNLPGIAATSTDQVTTQEMFYMSMLIEKAYIPFYTACGKATYGFMKQKARNVGLENPFYTGLDESLTHFQPNMYDPVDGEHNRAVYAGKLESTLGSGSWIEHQPVGSPYPNPVAAVFERPLPSLKPPFFQFRPPPPESY